MSKKPNNRPPRKCTSEAQKAAIRRYYAKKAAQTDNIPTVAVQIKNHRDKNGGHPHVIVEDIGNKHVSIGITHQKTKGKGHNNYPLELNPLGEKNKSYMRRQGTVDFQRSYYEPREGVMTEDDYTKAKEYGERAKQKYLQKNGKKK